MTDLRVLLLECRALAHGDHAHLLPKLEEAMQSLAAGRPAHNPAAQVALAWQSATRSLKYSHEGLYASLQERVMQILGARLPEEPVDELLRLEREVAELRAARDSHQQELSAMEERFRAELASLADAARVAGEQRNALLQALEAAEPTLRGDDPQALALARIETLVAAAQAPRAAGSGAHQSAASGAGPVPDPQVLQQVAAGHRDFSKEQRDWVVGEALGLTGWTLSPLELVEKGDAWLAALLLEKGGIPA